MKDPLFEPIAINTLEVRNRIYMPAMHLGMAAEFEVTDQLADFYTERAGRSGHDLRGVCHHRRTVGQHAEHRRPQE